MSAPVEEKHRRESASVFGVAGGDVQAWIKDGQHGHLRVIFSARRAAEIEAAAQALADIEDAATLAERRRIVALVLQVEHEIEHDRPHSPMAWMDDLQRRILDGMTTHESFADEAGKLLVP